jgi:branched-chain amino acid transport system permease protein
MQELIQHLINGLGLGSIYALIALGYTMVYGILRLINFAHADVYMVGAFAAYYISRWFNLEAHPGWLSFAITLGFAILSCALLGWLIERLAYRPLRKAPKLNSLITAIGVSLFLQYLAQLVFGADPKVFPVIIEDVQFASVWGVEIKNFDVVVLAVSLISMFLLHFFIHHSKTGKAMRAVSANASVASIFGINVNRIISMTFIAGSVLAAVGSVLVGIKYPKIDPLMGMMIGIKAFVAAVLGGIGNIVGAMLGGLLMGLSEEMVVAYFSSTYRDALAFGLLIIILLFRPSGLLGKHISEKV